MDKAKGSTKLSLLVKNRKNETPIGKPRVYFCSTKVDQEMYFEDISDDILKIVNCSIWYKNSEDISVKNDFGNDLTFSENFLSQVQLVVIPISETLLTDLENSLIYIEIKTAIDKSIAILPIMMEEGLEALYKSKFGDIQFIYKKNAENYQLTYEQKLERFLLEVLVGDELSAKIRAAFDAYIFLSYRKKDRSLAQELMRLIHQNESCRNIAIWYDEFLLPGEDFNVAIEKALKTSDLFTIMITPNLVEESNYVTEIEYPLARSEGKHIIPIEMYPTDEEQVKAQLDVKYILRVRERDFNTKLTNEIKEISLSTSPRSPEHDFFIGLAFLNGIDVEVDSERGACLIESAARQGVVAALKKIVRMYEMGESVKKDLSASIRWQQNLIGILQAKIASEINKIDMSFAEELWHLAALFNKAQKPSDAEMAYLRLYEYCSQSQDDLNEHIVHLLTISCNNLGSIYLLKNESSQAMEYYSYAIKHIKSYTYEDKPDFRRDLSVTYSNLGMAYEFAKNYQSSIEYYEKCLEIREWLLQSVGDYQDLRNIYNCYNNLACVCEKAHRDSEAEQYYKKTITIAELLVKQSRGNYERNEALANLKSAYNSIIEFYYNTDDISCEQRFRQKRDASLRQLKAIEP
ncbi:hypothetical protein B5F08_08050 [Anaeromassilibacillus sp. An172]|uniref:TIR domain-containing protein n=1 Tax=Anaeromassilibacillus sp. An172 TaxID=1965570 RepID=UPI000B3809F9|nr:TIR domain-containing protein [Anaeromassilibacillus sp. An172]OUP77722.1 hypothetical protein B5F08_08050 [Anaeromassilibacillus sp. An172]